MTRIYYVVNPGPSLSTAHNCFSVTPVSGLLTPPFLLDNWIAKSNTDINDEKPSQITFHSKDHTLS